MSPHQALEMPLSFILFIPTNISKTQKYQLLLLTPASRALTKRALLKQLGWRMASGQRQALKLEFVLCGSEYMTLCLESQCLPL